MSALSPRQMFLLDLACQPIRDAFDATPYLVGTAAEYRERKTYRDVDVRLILSDEQYDALVAGSPAGPDTVTFLGLAIGHYLAAMSGLPIDFQIQRQAEANRKHGRRVRHTHDDPIIGCRCEEQYGYVSPVRNPLGIRSLANYVGDATTSEDSR